MNAAPDSLDNSASSDETALEVFSPDAQATDQSTLNGTLATSKANATPDLPPLPDVRTPRFSWLSRIDWGARRVEWGVVALSFCIALAFVPQLLNFAHRDDYARDLVPGAFLWQPLEAAEYRLYDARFTARRKVLPRCLDKIAIVAIDQSSLQEIGQWPWPRDLHARLVRRLHRAGARVIALDINFTDRRDPKPDGSLSAGDAALVAAAEAAHNVVIVSSYRPQSKSNQDAKSGEAATADVTFTLTPFDELDVATPDLGLNYQLPASDGGYRRYVLRGQIGNDRVPSFALLATALYQGKLDWDENKAFYQTLATNRWPDADGRLHTPPLKWQTIREDRMGSMLLNFWGPAGTFRTYSYSSVLNAKGKDWSETALREKFGGKIVLIGGTADVLNDNKPVPLFISAENEEVSAPKIPGVELHASAVAQLLDGKYLRAQSFGSTLITLFGFTLFSSLWMIGFREPVSRLARWAQAKYAKWVCFGCTLPGRVHAPVWFFSFAILGALPPIVFWQVAIYLFKQHDFWLVTLYPLLAGGLSSGLALLLLFVVEAGERRKTVAHFARQVSPDVLEEILSRPEDDFVRPRRAHVTVLFSDLEGFTSYSESHEPEEVVAAMNDYMDRMVPIVDAHGGTIDKFIGDAIMAFFGAPIPRYDHPAQALLCAIALQEECARFREETGIPFYMRIGVHTGECIYGEIGSTGRANITVLGDTVNLASRLEGKNKEFGSWIMCSAQTYDAAPGVVEAELVSTPIKGKSQEVEVFLVRGMAGQPEQEKSWGHLEGTPDTPALGDTDTPQLPAQDAEPEPVLPALPAHLETVTETMENSVQKEAASTNQSTL